jgi:hypothetical protein
MDTCVRKVTIAESARHAAALFLATQEGQPNPHDLGSPEHQEWELAYRRYMDELVSGEGSA